MNTALDFAHSALMAQVGTHNVLGTTLWLAIVFFIVALVAWALGAGGVAGMSAGVGRMLLWVFLVLAIILLVVSFIPHTYY